MLTINQNIQQAVETSQKLLGVEAIQELEQLYGEQTIEEFFIDKTPEEILMSVKHCIELVARGHARRVTVDVGATGNIKIWFGASDRIEVVRFLSC
jgi:hypothetical protein